MKPDPLSERAAMPLVQATDHHVKLTNLRRLMAGTERRTAPTSANVCRTTSLHGPTFSWSFGLDDIDVALPQEGLARDGVHEFLGATHADSVAACGFLLALLKRFSTASQASDSGSVLWCQTTHGQREFGSIYGPGLEAFGFRSEHFLFARATRNRDALWALEEGARQPNLLAVVGEVDAMSFTQARRLGLAAAAGGIPVLLLRAHHDAMASAANTRWQIKTAPGRTDPFARHAPGHPRWRVALQRCRGGRPGAWTVEWNHETHRFRLAEQFSSRLPEVAGAPLPFPERRTACGS